MLSFIETTFKEPQYNHSYFLSDDKMHCLCYIPYGASKPVMFKIPLKFNPKGRTFKRASYKYIKMGR